MVETKEQTAEGMLMYELESGGDLWNGLMDALKIAKEQNRPVIYNTASAGRLSITPDMIERDAINAFQCELYVKSGRYCAKATPEEKRQAQKDGPDSIGLEEFYFIDANAMARESQKNVLNFCMANDIDPEALSFHYRLAVDWLRSQNLSYTPETAKRAAQLFDLPVSITEKNLKTLKKKLVLSQDDMRVKMAQNNSATNSRWNVLGRQRGPKSWV